MSDNVTVMAKAVMDSQNKQKCIDQAVLLLSNLESLEKHKTKIINALKQLDELNPLDYDLHSGRVDPAFNNRY